MLEPRQHHVEHDQVGVTLFGDPQRLRAVGGAEGLVAGALQVATNDLDDGRLVIDDEHGSMRRLGHGLDCPGRASRR
jgi:hypothetical protein